MQGRTDLAVEAATIGEGVTAEERTVGDMTVIKTVLTDQGARRCGKAAGTYVTAQFPALTDNEDDLERTAQVLGEELRSLLPQTGTVLVVGLGNEAITPDALGPRAVSMVLATRHIRGEFARSTGLCDLRPVAVVATGVLGNTGVESREMTESLCRTVSPAAVIAVDALAARSTARLGTTVQFSDTGIAPGSGVGNDREALTKETLGVPVIGVGMPTVVDAETIAREWAGETEPKGSSMMMVTPREIDLLILRAAKLIAMTLNAALQPEYSPLQLVTVAR